MRPEQSRIDRCSRALEAVGHLLPAGLHLEVFECIARFDESAIGMETLNDGLSELEIQIAPQQFRLIEGAMAMEEPWEARRPWSW